MKIEKSRREGNALILETKDPAAWRWLIQFRPGEYEIVRKKQKRSLDANAMAWKIIGEIAKETGLTTDEVYRETIRKIGGTSEVVCVQDKALDTLIRIWESKGLGWQAETFPSKTAGCTNVRLHYGSSVYDTKQMSLFIDALMQDAKALGIETMSDRERSLLLDAWT